MSARVLVSIVTYNSEQHIVPCLRFARNQSYRPIHIRVVDNASEDATVARIGAEFGPEIELLRHQVNRGFAAAHNQSVCLSDCDFVLVLNPDCFLGEHYVERLVALMRANPRLGSATGKLWRMDDLHRAVVDEGRPVLDTTGIYFLPNQRHLDRGAGKPDTGAYDRREWVFGASAAAGLYRRSMLEDAALDGEYFDEGFFVYREDVDLAWRAQLLGWSCVYEPAATGHHVRQGTPERRSALSAEINYHSVKNRLLLRVKNLSWRTYLRHAVAISFRDLLVLGYVCLRERRSARAFSYWRSHWRRYAAMRGRIAARRRVSDAAIEKWIGWRPRAYPFLEELPEATSAAALPQERGHGIGSTLSSGT